MNLTGCSRVRVKHLGSWASAALALAAIAVGIVSCSGPSDQERVAELKLGHVGAPGSLFAVSAQEFARRANERLQGRFKVSVFGSSQLGGDQVLMQKLKLGTVDLALPSSILSSIVSQFGLFEMPYLIEDREHMSRVEKEVFWTQLAPHALEQGYRILAVWENGFRHITNNRRPIVHPGDLEGIKLRTPRGVWRVRMFQAFGANPSPMALSEVFVALQTGVMDGQENPFAQIHSARLHEVQKYLSLTGHVYTPAFLASGAARWNRLPEDARRILEETAREVQAFVYERAESMDHELLQELQKAGMMVNRPDRETFLQASGEIYRQFTQEVSGGDELVQAVRELTKQAPAAGQ